MGANRGREEAEAGTHYGSGPSLSAPSSSSTLDILGRDVIGPVVAILDERERGTWFNNDI